jgi:hypothetical protein
VVSGYGAVREKLNTVKGATGALKGAFGDLLESIGKAAYGGSGFAGVLLRIRDRVVELGASTGFAALIAKIKTASAEAAALAKILLGLGDTSKAGAGWGTVANLLQAAIKLGGAEAANAIYGAFVKGSDILRDKIIGALKVVYTPGGPLKWLAGKAGSASVSAEQGIKDIADVYGAREDLKRAAGALSRIAAAEQAAQAATTPPAAEASPGLAGDVADALAMAGATEEQTKALKEHSDAIAETRKELDAMASAITDANVAKMWKEEAEALDDQLDKLKERKGLLDESLKGRTFGKDFDDWRAGQEEAKAEQKNAQAQMDRFNALQVKAGKRGLKLSPEDQQFLKDMQGRIDERNANLKEANAVQAGIDAAQAARDVVQQNIEASGKNLLVEFKELSRKFEDLLKAPPGG